MTLFDLLDTALAADDPTPLLAAVARRDDLDTALPEVWDLLLMDASSRGRHKATWPHSVAVAAKVPADDRLLRWAALLHDIGKPPTRRFSSGDVTFRHHEAAGETIVREMLPRIGCTDEVFTDRVARVVGLSGRFKARGEGGAAAVWSDAAVRRFDRDCGDLVDVVLRLAAVDNTSRHLDRADRQRREVDLLRARLAQVAAADARAAERPDLGGAAVMALLDLEPGPDVGAALKALLDAKRANGGPLGDPEGWLTDWWDRHDSKAA